MVKGEGGSKRQAEAKWKKAVDYASPVPETASTWCQVINFMKNQHLHNDDASVALSAHCPFAPFAAFV